MKIVIHWFRRDLRLTDNTALHTAARDAQVVIPIYIVSKWESHHRWTGAPRQQFLCACLESLAADLAKIGRRLIIRRGPALEALRQLQSETGAEAIYFNQDPDPFGRKVEESLAALPCLSRGFKDVGLHERSELLNQSGRPYRVFTPYAKAWHKLEKPVPQPAPRLLQAPSNLRCEELPTLSTWKLAASSTPFKAGEKAACQRMESFLEKSIGDYAEGRNIPAESATSHLSIDLRYGTISSRMLVARAAEVASQGIHAQRQSAHTFLNELAWRDFYFQVLWHWPEVLEVEFNPKHRTLRWSHSQSDFERWCAGETGFPLVDAGMRQLNESGWMHNRLRMITAMFLTKDLHLDWRLGEQYFMQRLVDGDIAANNGGWQWCAGTGADAAPYFRIQNPWAQTKRYDLEGAYIKRWLPELRDVPAAKLSRAPTGTARLAPNYPAPMVDHAKEREVCLEMFRRP